MGLYLDLKSKPENINASAFSEQKVLEPVEVYMGDDACGVETMSPKQTPLSIGDEDDEVNITGCTNSVRASVVGDSCDDVVTECSSSFGDTGSGTESASFFSDTEVESRMCFDDPSSSMCDEWCESCWGRKKRMTKGMTVHWRRFIRPVMWRCKWIELKLKQLQSQAHKYEKDLAAYNHTKQLDFAHLTLDGSDIKSVPISEKTDCTADACLKDFHGSCIAGADNDNYNDEDFTLNDVWSSGDYDNIDKSLDGIIQKIEAIESQVQLLKTRTNTVISKYPRKFCSVTQLSMHGPSDVFNHKSTSFAGNGDKHPFSFPHFSSQLQSEFNMGHLFMPGNASASREGIIPCIENIDRPELDDPWEDTKDGLLMQNQASKEKLHVGNHLVGRTKESVEEDISDFQVSEPDSPENAVHKEYSTLKSCSTLKPNIPRNKRKGRKKSGSKRRSKRSTG
ncbi:hypothetical protein VNO77_09068 [Canavalia gladiata]|uniref:Uncharacterized protein n=1 Tax=Canavalia gladiata TaxID=3824 RepID=A0AAN9QWE3_CANGL